MLRVNIQVRLCSWHRAHLMYWEWRVNAVVVGVRLWIMQRINRRSSPTPMKARRCLTALAFIVSEALEIRGVVQIVLPWVIGIIFDRPRNVETSILPTVQVISFAIFPLIENLINFYNGPVYVAELGYVVCIDIALSRCYRRASIAFKTNFLGKATVDGFGYAAAGNALVGASANQMLILTTVNWKLVAILPGVTRLRRLHRITLRRVSKNVILSVLKLILTI